MQSNFTHPTLMSPGDYIPTPHLSQANHAEPVLIPPYYDAHGVADYNAMLGWCYKQQSRARAVSSPCSNHILLKLCEIKLALLCCNLNTIKNAGCSVKHQETNRLTVLISARRDLLHQNHSNRFSVV